MTHQLRKKLTNNIPKVVASTLQNKPSGIHWTNELHARCVAIVDEFGGSS